MQQILAQYPNLQSQDEDLLCEELERFSSEDVGQYREVEPLLCHHIHRGSRRVRSRALDAWRRLVHQAGQILPHHLQLLHALASTEMHDESFSYKVIMAACSFAEKVPVPLLQVFLEHPEARVRRDLARALFRGGANGRFFGKREILLRLSQDPDAEVRTEACGSLSDFSDDGEVVYGLANQSDADPSLEVQRACIVVVGTAARCGFDALAVAVFEKRVTDPDEGIRKSVAGKLPTLPDHHAERAWPIAQRLFADPSPDVRRAMAKAFGRLHAPSPLQPLLQHAADNDPVEKVRVMAIESLPCVTPVAPLVAYYRAKLMENPPQQLTLAIVSGLRSAPRPVRSEPMVRDLLRQLAQHPNPEISAAARKA